MTPETFSRLRYGMFVHYGLFSMLERGEWAMNREGIAPAEMDDLAQAFDPAAYPVFIENTFARLTELATRFNPIDVLWYDGWWPFDAQGWQGERMNAALRAIQPHLLFNGRNGLPGDFGTPEGHLATPRPWRPWEACMTLNDHWGYHRGDTNWKSPIEVVKMLLKCGAERGNLLLNIGPRGDGSVPEDSAEIVRKVGRWLREGGEEAVGDVEPMPFGPLLREPGDSGDWDHAGVFTASGNTLFMTLLYFPGSKLVLTGLEMRVEGVDVAGWGPLAFTQRDGRLVVELPDALSARFCPVLRIACDPAPSLYRTGGMRAPAVAHPRYDPLPPDIAY